MVCLAYPFTKREHITRPSLWHPPVALAPAEQAIIKRTRRAKIFVFLRQQRYALFTDAFQTELAAVYKESPLGSPPIPPARLALATILQAYTGVSDDEVIEATTMNRRWQLVLDCPDCAEQAKEFGSRPLPAALDSSPLWRAGKVEDTSKAFGFGRMASCFVFLPPFPTVCLSR